MSKKITKQDLKNSKRLKRLELQMKMTVANHNQPISLSTLKSFYKNKASIRTTRSIVEVSDFFELNDSMMVNIQDYCSINPAASITYKTTGNIGGLRIDGKNGTPSGDTINCVGVNNNELFYLEIDASYHDSWTFKTSTIYIVEDGFARNRTGVDINGTGPFEDWV